MNKKGEIGGVGWVLVVAIAMIMGLVLFQQIATQVEAGTQTNTGASVTKNYSATAGPVGTITELPGQELVGTPVVYNGSGKVNIAANWTAYECVRTSDNLKGICYKATGNGNLDDGHGASNGSVKITYSYYPAGYIDDAGARAITGIIIILAAIGIALVALKKEYY